MRVLTAGLTFHSAAHTMYTSVTRNLGGDDASREQCVTASLALRAGHDPEKGEQIVNQHILCVFFSLDHCYLHVGFVLYVDDKKSSEPFTLLLTLEQRVLATVVEQCIFTSSKHCLVLDSSFTGYSYGLFHFFY